MHKEIVQKLHELEKLHDIKVLYAVESGSRGWGFESVDSDYDARFIYIHKPDWYLGIEEKEDFINEPVDEVFDVSGWDIRKSLRLFRKSNPPLLEWITSPIVYIEDDIFIEKLRNFASGVFNPISTIYHYLHIAKNKYEEIQGADSVKIKKYFYILRPILACKWVEEFGTMPPMEFNKILNEIELTPELSKSISDLLVKKAASVESDLEPVYPNMMEYFASKINYYAEYIKNVKFNKSSNTGLLDRLFQETLNDVWKE
ncbi:MAG TPA: hypothetical protein DEP72_01485 [Clostridiales bacterium]|nr:MAG: hypothetical protein A2Y18_05215 [Clostridiales bacterium GWD2_32_19]HCC06826.1 hypothetical protein [Clostridiales bacterium]